MEILFILEPWIELGNPRFRLGALKNQVRRLGSRYIQHGHSVTVIVGEGVEYALAGSGIDLGAVRLEVIPQRDLLARYKSSLTVSDELQTGKCEESQLAEYGRVFGRTLGEDYYPDVVLSWEAPIPYIQTLFPRALALHLMPGFMSRVPYPELISVDTSGFFQNSLLARNEDFFRHRKVTEEEAEFLAAVREHYISDFLEAANPFPRVRIDPSGKFKKLILLPLQVSRYFAFDSTSEYRNGIELVLDVLNTAPPGVGIVVTQYVTPNTQDCVLTDDVVGYLRSTYPNFVYLRDFDKVEAISQYLLGAVDAVACVSSSIGFQALLQSKPIFVFGTSHLSPFSAGTTTAAIARALDGEFRTYDGAVAFVLTRMQPLLLSRCYDGDWLVEFTNRALKLRLSGPVGLNAFEPIDDLGSYTIEFTESSKRRRARRKLIDSHVRLPAQGTETRGIAGIVSNGQHKAVSFDVFDTLICRPFARPSDLFEFMDSEVQKIGRGLLPDFKQLRIGAEAACRDRVRLRSGELEREITLAEIYQELAEQLGLGEKLRDRILGLELETERRFLRIRAIGRKAYDAAVGAGLPIYLVSDMYLPKEFLEEVLKNLGFSAHVELLLSSDIGCRKHEGELFDSLLESTGLHPEMILHVGDNPHGDRDVPRRRKFRAALLPSSIANLHAHPRWGADFRRQKSSLSLSQSMLLGVTARRLCDDPDTLADSHFGGSLGVLGYFGLGWMFVGMIQWLIEQARRDGIEVLYFLSRDGEILRDVYEQLGSAYESVPEAIYLSSSRRAARVAGIYSREDIINVAVGPFQEGTGREFLQKKFGLEIVEFTAGDFLDAEVGGVTGQSARIRCALRYEAQILRRASKERIAYQSYLAENGLMSSDRVAGVVDIGYAGTMQRALLKMTGRSQLAGYYMMTFADAAALVSTGQICRAYIAEFVEKNSCLHPFARQGLMFEVLLSNDEGSLQYFASNESGEAVPQKSQLTATPTMRTFHTELRAGLSDFVDDLVNTFGADVAKLRLDPDFALGPLTRLFADPHRDDADLFFGVTFDDDFGGAQLRYAVGPSSREPIASRAAVWRSGYQAAYDRTERLRPTESGNDGTPKHRLKWLISPLVRRFASPAKYRKYASDPSRFHADSRHFIVRWLG